MKKWLLTLSLLSLPLCITAAQQNATQPASTYDSLAEHKDLSSLSFEKREALQAFLDGFDEIRQEVYSRLNELGSQSQAGIAVLQELTGASGFTVVFELIPQTSEQEAEARSQE